MCLHSCHNASQLYIFEDNKAVIKMIIEGRSPTMRHVSRTHRVALDWLFDRINLELKTQIEYVDTTNQLADIVTKGSLSRDEWNHLLRLFNIMNFSMYSYSHFSNFLSDNSDQVGKQSAMSKRSQKTTSDEGSPIGESETMPGASRARCEGVRRSLSRRFGISGQSGGTPMKEKKSYRASRQLLLPDSNSQIGYSQASREENVQQATRKLVPEDQNQTESDEGKY